LVTSPAPIVLPDRQMGNNTDDALASSAGGMAFSDTPANRRPNAYDFCLIVSNWHPMYIAERIDRAAANADNEARRRLPGMRISPREKKTALLVVQAGNDHYWGITA
jgi:hypothetical protein